MFSSLQKKIDLTNLFRLSKQNKLYINILLFGVLLLPISIIAGPLILEILIFLIFVSYLYYFFTSKRNKIKLHYIEILVFTFFFVFILSSLLSEHKLISLKSSVFSIRFIIYFYAVFFLLNKLKYFQKYFFIICATCLLFAIFDGYIQLFTGKNIFLLEKINKHIVSGVFGDEKKLGSFLVRFSPLVIGFYLLFSRQKLEKQWNYLIAFCLSLLFLIWFTAERIALAYCLVTLLFVAIYFLKKGGDKLKFLMFLFSWIIIPGFLVVWVNMFQLVIKNTYKQLTPKGDIIFFSYVHEDYALTSIELFKKKKIFGIGPNNFRRDCHKIVLIRSINENRNINYCSTHPHNIFFQLLAETGIAGITIYLFIIFVLFKELIKFFIKKNFFHEKVFFLLPIIYYLNPLFPSGNFFNNWYMFIGIIGVPFYLYWSKIKKSAK